MKQNIYKNTMRLGMLMSIPLLTACQYEAASLEGATSIALNNRVEERIGTNGKSLVSWQEEDEYTEWQNASMINCQSSEITVSGQGVVVEGETITINTPGTYVVTGNIRDGGIVVDTHIEGTVRLVLNGVTMTSTHGSPLYVKNADKVILSLVDGTVNEFTDGKTYDYVTTSEDDKVPDAVIYSQDDLIINGTGTLKVNGQYHDGIVTKDQLKIVSGNFEVNAVNHGIVGKDYVAIKSGEFKITAGGDGLKSSNSEDVEKGFIIIEDGKFDITSERDGIQAETNLYIDGGEFSIVTGGGSEAAPAKVETMPGGQGGFGKLGMGVAPEEAGQFAPPNEGQMMPEEAGQFAPPNEGQAPPENEGQMMPEGVGQLEPPQRGQMPSEGNQNVTVEADRKASEEAQQVAAVNQIAHVESEEIITSDSSKGLKAGQLIEITHGKVTIDAYEDAIHSDGSVRILGGEMNILSGDDGIHGETDLTIEDGIVHITKSYEGIEAEEITINGGKIYVTSSDDGINVSVEAEEETSSITDSTQKTQVEEATNEQISSMPNKEMPGGMQMGSPFGVSGDGKLNINGGYIVVDAQGDGIDINGTATMTGGTTIVYGPTNNGNAALDYDLAFDVSGGLLVAVGSSGMAQGIADTSKQYAVQMTYDTQQEAGTLVSLVDKNQEALLTLAPTKAFQWVMISSPEIKANETYRLYKDGTAQGEVKDGIYIEPVYTPQDEGVTFEISDVITYLNEEGVTTKQSGMMGRREGHTNRHREQSSTKE